MNFVVAVRHQDGSKNLYRIGFDEQCTHEQVIAEIHRQVPTSKTVLCGIQGQIGSRQGYEAA